MMAKRKDFSLSEKYELLKNFDLMAKCNQREAAAKLGVKQPFLCRILKQRYKIIEEYERNGNLNRKRQRGGKAEDVETALLQWFKLAQTKNIELSRADLIFKAEEFAKDFGIDGFTATFGWLTRWKDRNNIPSKRKSGVKDLVKCSNLSEYSENNTYCIYETVLYYRALPDHILMLKNESHLVDKEIKNQITVLLACNMTGTIKKRPLVIGDSSDLYCLEGVKHFPVEYSNNAKAWITSEIFVAYMKKWDRNLGNEKIAVLLSSCTAHPEVEFQNIRLFYLPQNSSSDIETLNLTCTSNIIRNFKAFYRRNVRIKIIDAIEDPKRLTADDIAKSISLLDALHMLESAWEKVTPKVIFNSLKKSELVTVQQSKIKEEEQDSLFGEELGEKFWEWVDIDVDVPTSAEQLEEDIVLSLLKHEIIEEELENDTKNNLESLLPSALESRQALQILRRTLEQRGASSDDYSSYYDIEERICKLLSKTSKQQ